MDYDRWLTTEPDYGPDVDEMWDSIGWRFWDWVDDYFETTSCKEFLYESPYCVEALCDLWDKELESDKYDENSPYLVDLWELSEKYPEVADEFYNRVKPKNEDELYEFVTDDDISDFYNSYWSMY